MNNIGIGTFTALLRLNIRVEFDAFRYLGQDDYYCAVTVNLNLYYP